MRRRGRTYCQARSIASPTPASALQRRISAAQSSAIASASRASSRWRSPSSRSRQSQPARSPRVANSPRSTVLPVPRMPVSVQFGVRRVGLAEVALELDEQRVAAREVRRGDPVSWSERVRELFSSRVLARRGSCRYPCCDVVVGPGSAAWRLPGQRCAPVDPHSPTACRPGRGTTSGCEPRCGPRRGRPRCRGRCPAR